MGEMPRIVRNKGEVGLPCDRSNKKIKVVNWTPLSLKLMLQATICLKRRVDRKHFEMLDDEVNIVKMFGSFALRRTIVEFGYGNVGNETVFNPNMDDSLAYARNVLDQRNADVRV